MLSVKSVFNNKKQAFVAFLMILCGLLAPMSLSAFNGPDSGRVQKKTTEAGILESFPSESDDFPVYLYFADHSNLFLLGEERTGLGSDDPVVFCRQLADALIQGPSSSLVRTLPAETEVRAIFIDDRTVYVDLSREAAASHPGGIQSELMAIYSLVNTLVLNIDGVDQVKILIAGQEAETLSGHIDIRSPLKADILFIR